MPDLVVTAFFAQAVKADQSIPMTVTVRNQGTADAGPSHLHFFAYWASPPTLTDPPRLIADVPPLRAGEAVSVQAELPAGTLTAETHLLWVLTDGRDLVAELDESNNTLSTKVTVGVAPTATPTATQTPAPTPTPGAALPPSATPEILSTVSSQGTAAQTLPGAGADTVNDAVVRVVDTGAASRPAEPSAAQVRGASAAPSRALSRGGWSEPIRISSDADTWPWFPDVAADDLGNVHVVWNGSFVDGPKADPLADGKMLVANTTNPTRETHQVGALFYSRWGGTAWSEPNDIALVWYGHALRSSIAVDASGSVHLVYKGFGASVTNEQLDFSRSLGPEDLWYTRAVGNSQSVLSWEVPKRITRGRQGYFSDVVVDRRGTVHVIWTESDDGGWGLYYAKSADGGATWSERTALDERDSVWWYRAQLKVDTQDRLHAAWEVNDRSSRIREGSIGFGTTTATVYAISTDLGSTWSTVRFAGGSDSGPGQTFLETGPQQPAIGIDGRGTILFVFREPGTNRVFYRRSANGSDWSPPAPLPEVEAGPARPYDVYDLVTDSAGRVHLAMVGYPTGSSTMSLLHLEWDGQSWGEPHAVTEASRFPEYPRLALGEGNRLHLVWFEGDRESTDRAPIGVWYSTLETSAPRLARTHSPAALSVVPRLSVSATSTPASAKPTEPTPLRRSTVDPLPQVGARDTPDWLLAVLSHRTFPYLIGLTPSVVVILILLAAKLGRFEARHTGFRGR